jgi:hypothetical protein
VPGAGLEEKDRMKKRLLIVVVAFFLCVIVCAQDNNSYRPEFSLLQNRYGGITITSYNGTARDVVIP